MKGCQNVRCDFVEEKLLQCEGTNGLKTDPAEQVVHAAAILRDALSESIEICKDDDETIKYNPRILESIDKENMGSTIQLLASEISNIILITTKKNRDLRSTAHQLHQRIQQLEGQLKAIKIQAEMWSKQIQRERQISSRLRSQFSCSSFQQKTLNYRVEALENALDQWKLKGFKPISLWKKEAQIADRMTHNQRHKRQLKTKNTPPFGQIHTRQHSKKSEITKYLREWKADKQQFAQKPFDMQVASRKTNTSEPGQGDEISSVRTINSTTIQCQKKQGFNQKAVTPVKEKISSIIHTNLPLETAKSKEGNTLLRNPIKQLRSSITLCKNKLANYKHRNYVLRFRCNSAPCTKPPSWRQWLKGVDDKADQSSNYQTNIQQKISANISANYSKEGAMFRSSNLSNLSCPNLSKCLTASPGSSFCTHEFQPIFNAYCAPYTEESCDLYACDRSEKAAERFAYKPLSQKNQKQTIDTNKPQIYIPKELSNKASMEPSIIFPLAKSENPSLSHYRLTPVGNILNLEKRVSSTVFERPICIAKSIPALEAPSGEFSCGIQDVPKNLDTFSVENTMNGVTHEPTNSENLENMERTELRHTENCQRDTTIHSRNIPDGEFRLHPIHAFCREISAHKTLDLENKHFSAFQFYSSPRSCWPVIRKNCMLDRLPTPSTESQSNSCDHMHTSITSDKVDLAANSSLSEKNTASKQGYRAQTVAGSVPHSRASAVKTKLSAYLPDNYNGHTKTYFNNFQNATREKPNFSPKRSLYPIRRYTSTSEIIDLAANNPDGYSHTPKFLCTFKNLKSLYPNLNQEQYNPLPQSTNKTDCTASGLYCNGGIGKFFPKQSEHQVERHADTRVKQPYTPSNTVDMTSASNKQLNLRYLVFQKSQQCAKNSLEPLQPKHLNVAKAFNNGKFGVERTTT